MNSARMRYLALLVALALSGCSVFLTPSRAVKRGQPPRACPGVALPVVDTVIALIGVVVAGNGYAEHGWESPPGGPGPTALGLAGGVLFAGSAAYGFHDRATCGSSGR